MKPRLILTVLAVILSAFVLNGTAYAQERYEFKIPFAFVANGKALPAGDYYLVTDENAQMITLESKNVKADVVMMPVETRIQEFKPAANAELVFDKLNDKSYVAELLPPGTDGYILLVTKPKHTHHSLKGAHATK